MDCETIRELLEEYTLDSLSPAEQQQVAAHLATCTACRAMAADYADLLARLPVALAAVSPYRLPAAVKQRVLQQLETDVPAQLPAGTVVQGDSQMSNPTPTPVVPPAVRAAPGQTIHVRLRRLRWALAAAVLLLVIVLAWSIRLNVVLARERALRAEFVELVGQQQELVLEVVDSGHTTRRILRATTEGSTAYGKVFTRSDMAHVVAMAARLSQPPLGQAYHLWLVRGDETELAGMMRVNADGFGLVIYEAAQPDPLYDRAYVTLQPQNSTTPQGEPVIAWQAEE